MTEKIPMTMSKILMNERALYTRIGYKLFTMHKRFMECLLTNLKEIPEYPQFSKQKRSDPQNLTRPILIEVSK
jgi:hypothetical protein